MPSLPRALDPPSSPPSCFSREVQLSAWGVPPPGLGRHPWVATPAWVRRAHRALLPGTERNKEAPKRVRGASPSLPPSLPPGALPVVRRYQGRGRRDLRNPPSQPTPTPCEPKLWVCALPRAPFWVGRLCPRQCPGLAEALAGAGSGGAWQVRPLLPWVAAGEEDAWCGCFSSASLVPGRSAGPASRVSAGAAGHFAYRTAPCTQAGREPLGKTRQVHFWLEVRLLLPLHSWIVTMQQNPRAQTLWPLHHPFLQRLLIALPL